MQSQCYTFVGGDSVPMEGVGALVTGLSLFDECKGDYEVLKQPE